MEDIQWDRYPLIAVNQQARAWLTIQANLGLAHNTIEAYGRGLEDYFTFSQRCAIEPETATKAHIAAYVRDLTQRPNPRHKKIIYLHSGAGLSNATMQQRVTAVRLYYDHLVEEGIRPDNPVGRGRYTPGKGFGGSRDRALIPRFRKLPWIPNDEQWQAILEAGKSEPLRNRVMMAFAYDAGLRREELCTLSTNDIRPAQRLLTIRAENTKNRQERVVPYSVATGELFALYLQERRSLSRERGPLFLSESRRNRAQPISFWTWSKVVEGIAEQAEVSQFTTHTFRHLCLTDLARAGWDIHEIAKFAGHRSTETTLLYIHLSGRELAEKFERGMASIHAWRIKKLAEVLK